MSRKKTQLDEFGAMADVHKILVHFDSHARARIVASVEGKISAEAPKKRVRNRRPQDLQPGSMSNGKPHGAAELM